jgi:hypothetical protein
MSSKGMEASDDEMDSFDDADDAMDDDLLDPNNKAGRA